MIFIFDTKKKSLRFDIGISGMEIELTIPKFRTFVIYSIYGVIGAVGGLIFWPFALITWLLLKVIRGLVTLILTIFYGRGTFELANGHDALYSYSRHSPGAYINLISIVSEEDVNAQSGITAIDKIKELLNQDKFEKLKWVFTKKMGFSCWRKNLPFNLDDHIRTPKSINPDEILNYEKVQDLFQNLSVFEMADDKPQWEFWIMKNKFQFEDGTIGGEYVILMRYQHAYMDGVNTALMFQEMSETKLRVIIDPMQQLTIARWFMTLTYIKALWLGPTNAFFKGFVNTMRGLFDDFSWPRNLKTTPNHLLSGISSTIPLDLLKGIRTATNSSVSAILSAAISVSMHQAHQRMFPGKKSLPWVNSIVAMPRSTYRELEIRNRTSVAPEKLDLRGLEDINDVSSVRKVIGRCKGTKEFVLTTEPFFNYYAMAFMGELPVWLKHSLLSIGLVPFLFSNIPGTEEGEIKILGRVVHDLIVLGPPCFTNTNITTTTIHGHLRAAVIGNPQIWQSTENIKEFANDIEQTLRKFSDILASEKSELGFDNNGFITEIV